MKGEAWDCSGVRRPSKMSPNAARYAGERLPDDADECAMCGADLKPLRPAFERRVGEPVERD
jgi:hypothetical protein